MFNKFILFSNLANKTINLSMIRSYKTNRKNSICIWTKLEIKKKEDIKNTQQKNKKCKNIHKENKAFFLLAHKRDK